MKNQNKNCASGNNGGFITGLVLILLGLLFLGVNFGWISPDQKLLLFSWQSLLILIGVVSLCKRNFTTGFVLIAVGGFFIIPRVARVYPEIFGDISTDFTRTFWPALLIVAGVFILFSRYLFRPRRSRRNCCHTDLHSDTRYEGRKQTLTSGFNYNAVFSGGEYIVLDPVFAGGGLNAVFGGITLDLRKTTLSEGENLLSVNALFGGITLYIPSEWVVELKIDSFAGGVDDNRSRNTSYDTTRKLIVKGSSVFGGVEIKN